MKDEKLKLLPNTYTIVCEWDPLKDQNLAFGQRLKDVGVKSKTVYYEACSHGTVNQIGVYSGFQMSNKILQDMIEYIQANL